jgi:pyruvate/2-oxoglutarate dehydrogenase complex dihydrolipoamide dehydrogenase (E3) component
VYRPEDILLNGARPAGNVIVLDGEGYHTGTGIADMLAAAGADVKLGTAGHSPVSPRLTDNWEERYIVGRLKSGGVQLTRNMWLHHIGSDTATLYDVHTGEEHTEMVDAVVLATARVPQDQLGKELHGRAGRLFVIGDALGGHMLAAATYEGQKFARAIGEPGAPATTSEPGSA